MQKKESWWDRKIIVGSRQKAVGRRQKAEGRKQKAVGKKTAVVLSEEEISNEKSHCDWIGDFWFQYR